MFYDIKLISCYRSEDISRIEVVDGYKILVFDDYRKTIKDCVFMQCTGLKDRYGKLIYEGDIVQYYEYDDYFVQQLEAHKPEQAVVIWGDEYDYPAFDLKDTDFSGINGLSYIFGEGWKIEVIGNIYENEELIKE